MYTTGKIAKNERFIDLRNIKWLRERPLLSLNIHMLSYLYGKTGILADISDVGSKSPGGTEREG